MLLSQAQPYGRLTDLPNINPRVASRLKRIGIRTPDDFLNRDPYQVFDVIDSRLKKDLSKKDLAMLVGAQKGCSWSSVLHEVTQEYRLRKPGHIWSE